jgi:NAD(P)H-dependent FMN reductase
LTNAPIPGANGPSGRTERIAVLIGSTRPTRICEGIARWVLRFAQEDSPLTYQLIDLAEVNLPFLDEPLKAALRQYRREHTKAWSRTVQSYDGFIFVFPNTTGDTRRH